MMRIGNKRGFSLVELLAAIVVAGIVVLMVGAIGTISVKSYNDLRNKSNVYNDSQFALQLIRESVRESTVVPIITGSCLTVATQSFYIQGTNFVYGNACNNPTNTPIISGVTNLGFTPVLSPLPVGNVTLYNISLNGTKNNVTFNYSMNVSRRNS